MPISLDRQGRRTYFRNAPFSAKEMLRDAGAKWDGAERAWWMGDATKAAALLERINASAATSPDADAAAMLKRDHDNILGRATKDAKSYYVVGEGQNARGPWVRLMFHDGTQTFFAAAGDVTVTKRYRAPMTLAAIQRFAEQARSDRATGGGCACSCHRQGDGPGTTLYDGCDRCGCLGSWG